MNETYRQYLIDGERAGARYALASPRNVPFGASGNQMSKRPGSSLEFIDHREYQPGDDLRRIDWGGFARSDKLTVKLYRDEVSPHLDVVIDGSCSMALENSPKRKPLSDLRRSLLWRHQTSGTPTPHGWQEMGFGR